MIKIILVQGNRCPLEIKIILVLPILSSLRLISVYRNVTLIFHSKLNCLFWQDIYFGPVFATSLKLW